MKTFTFVIVVGVGLAILLLLVPLSAEIQTFQRLDLLIEETAGIRRTRYPVNVRVPFPQGALARPDEVRLLLGDEEIPGQFFSSANWPDTSVQWLALSFNASIGPLETRTYRLEYGPGVGAGAKPERPLILVDESGVVQVGRVHFTKTGSPLFRLVGYRGQVIGSGLNGFAVEDASGTIYELGGNISVTSETIRSGPLYVEFRYSGRIVLRGGIETPFVVTVEMPNSKSWVKTTAVVNDADQRLRKLSFHIPLDLGQRPWVWDFGTPRWTYGVLRNDEGSVILTNNVGIRGATEWRVEAGPKGREQLYETSGTTQAVAVEWGHLQGGKEAVAFGLDHFADAPGTYRMEVDGMGQASFHAVPAIRVTQHRLTVYLHFVGSPVQIGAATSPPSMLQPLVVHVDPKQYAVSGMEPPAAR